jgi:AcrR family transcriptional regulator
MSLEPGLGSPARAPAAAADSQHGGRQVAARREARPVGSVQRVPPASQARTRDVTTTNKVPETAGRNDPQPAGSPRSRRPSLGGGTPAQQRDLGAQGRQTVRRLLEAGLAEFEETGLQATRVEDIVRRAKTSHGTFYLYFSNKDDLFRTLLQDALHDMALITDEFPVVTANDAGRAALRRWVERFSGTYAVHATVLRILTQAEIVGEDVYADGLQQLFRLSEVMTQGMTAAHKVEEPSDGSGPAPHAELTAVACLMMLERVNYLFSAEVRMPRDEMNDRLAAIIYAAFRSP